MNRVVPLSEEEARALAAVRALGPAVIYAPGGGLGHLSRALVLARALEVVAIVHQAASLPALPPPPGVELVAIAPEWDAERVRARLRELAERAPVLVVDSFPAGVAGELDDALLSAFAHRVLVRRYLRPGAYDAIADEDALVAGYDLRLLPYRAAACEWDGDSAAGDGAHVGFLVRALTVGDALAGADAGETGAELVVIGEAARLPATWRALFPERTRLLSGPFAALPAAERYLGIGAGHNLCYELLSAGVEFALVPEERRYDDQFRRAGRLGVGVHSRDDLAAWLSAPRQFIAANAGAAAGVGAISSCWSNIRARVEEARS
ncbi:hypothetical protein [Haliangium ochraceum]|uniref:hypothetical protein n=1 Tax=Haliangium ochraceum TaxID=80816 RepID=UPI00019BA00E|nr:hypothetical protein [Haliangium ochraceum]